MPPFRHEAEWREAIEQAVHAAGLRLHDLDAAPERAPVNDSDVVIVTADASQAVAAGAPAEAVAGLMVDKGIRLTVEENPQVIPPLTALLGRIGLLPPERVFRSEDFASGSVEIFPRVQLHRPDNLFKAPLSPRMQALNEAVALLDPAHPEAMWTPALFSSDSRIVPGGAPGQLDLTGRPRYLISGPYIVLPAGRWRATYRLTFDEKGSRIRFRIDWGTVENYVSEEFTPGRAGVFEVVQEYDWAEPAPCELRVIVTEGVFDGRMTFSGAQVSRIG